MKFNQFLLYSAVIAVPTQGPYTGSQLLKIPVDNESLKLLKKMISNDDLKLNVWKESRGEIDVMVPSASVDMVTKAFPDSEILIQDIQELVDRENINLEQNVAESIHSNYQSSEVLINFVTSLPGAIPISIGSTFEGRELKGIKLGSGGLQAVLTGGLHAREWISPATVTYLAEFLASNESDAVKLRSEYTFHIIPVINRDGYEFSRSPNNRFWRKNREPNPNSKCIGVDINRNFGYKWGELGASADPCNDEYRGPAKQSSREAQSLDTYVKSLKNVISFTDFHSYGQHWLYPWGSTCNGVAPDNNDFVSASKAAINALEGEFGTNYDFGGACKLTYQTSGTTDDHFYVEGRVKYSFTIELRDDGYFGFNLPSNQIIPTGKEIVKAMTAFWNYAKEHSQRA